MLHRELLDGPAFLLRVLGVLARHTESLHVNSNLRRLVALHSDGVLVLSVSTAIAITAAVSFNALVDNKHALRLRTGDRLFGNTGR